MAMEEMHGQALKSTSPCRIPPCAKAKSEILSASPVWGVGVIHMFSCEKWIENYLAFSTEQLIMCPLDKKY